MADSVLDGLLKGELHHSNIIQSLSNNAAIKYKDLNVEMKEFIPHFMAFLRTRLLQNNDQPGSTKLYFSPRQKEEQRKAERDKFKTANTKTNTIGRSARVSLQYSSSSPMKAYNDNNKNSSNHFHQSSDIVLSGISPIRKTDQNSKRNNRSRNSRKTSKVKTKPVTFEISSMEDFPSISLSGNVGGGGGNSASKKNPRRITATTVGIIRNDSNASQCNGMDSSQSFNETSSSFLEGSCFEIQNADPSFENLFQGDNQRFNNNNNPKTPVDNLSLDVNNLSLKNDGKIDVTPTKAKTDVLNLHNVHETETLDVVSEIYSYICKWNLVPNVTLEIYFLFTILTTRGWSSDGNVLAQPFINIECVVYFAVKCLENLKEIILMLDAKSLMLLFENSRFQQFTNSHFLERLEKEINADESFNLSLNCGPIVKSPNTGIAFQTDSDNRKRFISDRHFYSFSKKRDAFYSIVREWEENIADPEWNLTAFLTKKVGQVIKVRDGLDNDFQFARLFVAQLVEMHKNQVGDKTEEPETSDGVLLELKKRDPIRYQSLQNRLTGPSSTCDPCPKLSFSKVEEFFKEFIRIADSYMLSKSLVHVLLVKIKSQDSNSFGLNQQINSQLNKSDFSDTLWQEMKSNILELRLYAKFLGFILFLPYNSLSDNADVICTRELLTEPLHLTNFLKEAFRKHRLIMTVPWVVDFISFADKKVFLVKSYMEPLNYLHFLYKNLSLKLKDSSSFILNFSLTLHIGWLFDRNPTDAMDFYQSNYFDDSHVSNAGDVIGLDDIVVGDKSFVYMLCPYLKVIKRPLSDFKRKVIINNNGTFRKITPVRSTEIHQIDTQANLKNQLLDGFMKYVPNHVKDCMSYVTDRLFVNMKNHVCQTIFPIAQEDGLELLKERFSDVVVEENESEKKRKKDSLTSENKRLYLDCLEDCFYEAKTKCQSYILSYLSNTIDVTMKCLLPEDTNPKMLEVSSKVVRHNVCLKIQEWLATNRNLFTNGFEVLYKKHLNNFKKTNREESMLGFEETT